jgi:hypothetical protein
LTFSKNELRAGGRERQSREWPVITRRQRRSLQYGDALARIAELEATTQSMNACILLLSTALEDAQSRLVALESHSRPLLKRAGAGNLVLVADRLAAAPIQGSP